MTQRKIPARLDVLLAPKARKAVVLRRGPAKFVCTVGWDLSTDTVEIGQWIEGRIHTYCCDLSPDGKYFVYYVMKARNYPDQWHWTAISRAPYLKAIGRWQVAGGCHGGGFFLSKAKFWLNNQDGVYSECNELTQETIEPTDGFSRDWRRIYFRKSLRDGWTVEKKINLATRLDIFTLIKAIGEHGVLKNTIDASGIGGSGRGMFSCDYQIVNCETGDVQYCRDWEWADVDGDRLLWAQGGKLWLANIEGHGLGAAKMLHDFNEMTFQEIEAPY